MCSTGRPTTVYAHMQLTLPWQKPSLLDPSPDSSQSCMPPPQGSSHVPPVMLIMIIVLRREAKHLRVG